MILEVYKIDNPIAPRRLYLPTPYFRDTPGTKFSPSSQKVIDLPVSMLSIHCPYKN